MTTDGGTLMLNGTASVTDSIVLDSGSGDLTVTGALLATTNGTHDVTINSGGTAKIGVRWAMQLRLLIFSLPT